MADRPELSAALWACIVELAARAARERGRFCLALSGGSLLDLMIAGLGSDALRGNVRWSKWHVFWADERWARWSSPDSNYGLARNRLFSRLHIPAEQIHAMDDSLSPTETAERYESILAQVIRPAQGQVPRFDLILLGLGDDGHTASLFPNHPALQETRRWVVPVWNAPKPPPTRITLTLPVINQARQVVFVATGASKAQIVSRVLQPGTNQPELPAQRVKPSRGELRWFVDRDAAADLSARSASGVDGFPGTQP